jgi:CBS domain-containing protein
MGSVANAVSRNCVEAAPASGHPCVADLMRSCPITITPKESLAAAKTLMDRGALHQLPVVEDGRLVGIISERDLHAHTGYWERTKVDAAMTWNPITVAPEQPASNVARILINKNINALPVVEGERLLGIVTRSDLLQLLITLLEAR